MLSSFTYSGNKVITAYGLQDRQNKYFQERYKIMKYICEVCGWEYDEEAGDLENGIEPGTKFEDLPDDFACPLCGVDKENFSEAE